jgi:C4-dicarboxylate-specific signal transduction histidine kinase
MLKVRVRKRTDDLLAANQALQEQITERKQAEVQLRQANAEVARRETALRDALSNLKAVQSRLIQAEKLESIGRLAAGVAHEVKNPLAIMLQGIHYLSKHIATNGDNVTMALQEMNDAVKRADSVVGPAGFLRPERIKPEH